MINEGIFHYGNNSSTLYNDDTLYKALMRKDRFVQIMIFLYNLIMLLRFSEFLTLAKLTFHWSNSIYYINILIYIE